MLSNIFLGYNVSSLPFNFFATLRCYDTHSIDKHTAKLYLLMSKLSSVDMLNYNIEKGEEKDQIHSHILFYVTDPSLFKKEIEACMQPYVIISGERKVICKVPKTKDDLKNEAAFKDVIIDVDYTKYLSKRTELHLERIGTVANASIYSFKFNSYGLNSGFIMRGENTEFFLKKKNNRL